jgi:hypothetical protein
MNRIVIAETDEYSGERTVIGHFDYDKAERFEEDTRWDGNNHISVNTSSQWDHQQLLRTAGGRWVLNTWSQDQGRPETYEFISDDKAREWLLFNKEDEAVEKYFGEVEEEKGPGRPEVGPATNVRLGEELTAKVDAARRDGESRAAAIRRLLAAALA